MDTKRISRLSRSHAGRNTGDPDLTSVTRRDWLKVAAGGSVGLALGGLLDLPKVRAAVQDFKLVNVREFTNDAVGRIAEKIRKTRDATWVATEKLGDAQVPVNRTDAIAFMGGAQNTNEECYLFQKAARLLGMPFVEHQARL